MHAAIGKWNKKLDSLTERLKTAKAEPKSRQRHEKKKRLNAKLVKVRGKLQATQIKGLSLAQGRPEATATSKARVNPKLPTSSAKMGASRDFVTLKRMFTTLETDIQVEGTTPFCQRVELLAQFA